MFICFRLFSYLNTIYSYLSSWYFKRWNRFTRVLFSVLTPSATEVRSDYKNVLINQNEDEDAS